MAVILGWLLHVLIFRESTFGEREKYLKKKLWRLLQDYIFREKITVAVFNLDHYKFTLSTKALLEGERSL